MKLLVKRPVWTVALIGAIGVGGVVIARTAKSTPRQTIGDHAAPQPPFQDPGHVHYPRGTIVGQFTPELIPTDLAVRMMLRSVATASERDATTGSKLLPAYFRLIAGPAITHHPDLFDSQQQELVVTAALEYHRETGAETRAPMDGSFGTHTNNKAKQVWERLRSTMSPDAFTLLDLHVNGRVKRGITVRP